MANYRAGKKLTDTELIGVDRSDVILARFRDSGAEVVGQKGNLDMSLNWAIRTNMIDYYRVSVVDMTPRVDMFEGYPNIEEPE